MILKIYYSNILLLWAKTDRGSNPGGGGRIFCLPVQTVPGTQPASCTMDTGYFSGARGRG